MADVPKSIEASATERVAVKLFAWTGFIVAIAALLTSLVFYQLLGGRTVARFVSGPAPVVVATVVAAVFATLGLTLALRRPRHPVGWILLLAGLVLAVPGNLAAAYASYALLADPPELPAPEVVAWLATLLTNAAGSLLMPMLVLIFPTGRLLSPRWRLVVGLLVLGALLFAIQLAFAPGPLINYIQIDNPFGVPEPLGTVAVIVGSLGATLVVVAWLAAIFSMVRRFRVADERERQQLKWFGLASGILVALGLAFLVVRTLSPTHPAGEAVLVVALASFALIPISVAIAILRYRLYDIDELISATVVYVALTGILAGIYAASIRLFNWIFVALTGESSEAALVLTTLALAASFTPVKEWLQDAVKSRYKHEAGSETQPSAPSAASTDDPELDERIRRVVQAELARRR
jgi:hypothetical protein